MARDLEHFALPLYEGEAPRRKRSAGPPSRRGNRSEHGRELDRQLDEVAAELQRRVARRAQGINPKLVFRLEFKAGFTELDDETLDRWGLTVLARGDDGVLVVSPDEATVHELRRGVREYAGLADGSAYGELDAIESVRPLSPEDRIGPRLRQEPLGEDETAPLDIELWHSGNREECRAWIREIAEALNRLDLRVTDDYVGASLCVIRAKVNQAALRVLLDPDADYIKQIERRPSPSFEMGALVHIDATDLEQAIEAAPDDLVGVVIVDSGVATAHPLLRGIIGDAQVFPREGDNDNAGDVDERSGGHGTAVAGIAAYADLAEGISSRRFAPQATVFSARVTDENNEYDPDYLLEHQLEQAVTYFIDNYRHVRVINISLGDSSRVYHERDYQFRFAAAIDELAYRYRDRELLFVVSSGNAVLTGRSGEEVFQNYPGYLLEEENRLVDPATSAIALTVGGLSFGEAARLDNAHIDRTDRLVAGEQGWPCPFTRTGPGVNGAIKPELVDFAGDFRLERGRIPAVPQHAGLPSTSKQFSPPEGRLFRTVAGTSFAAPRVSNLAARLFRELPGASSNLVRALIADSARLPASRPPALGRVDPTAPDTLRLYGYGQPDFDRARWSAENEVLLIADGSIAVDTFLLYRVPSLPPSFFDERGAGTLSVTLAFDPPTRHTRADSYLGLTMEAQLFRNRQLDDIRDALRAYDRDGKLALREDESIPLRKVPLPNRGTLKKAGDGSSEVALLPGVNVRKKGTLQRGTHRIASRTWSYDGNPMTLAVICQRFWAPEDITHQRFAVCVSISHENPDVKLHTHIRAQLRIAERVRVNG